MVTYVYRPGKKEAKLILREEARLYHSFIKDIRSTQSRKQLHRLFNVASRARITEDTLEAGRLMRKSGRKEGVMGTKSKGKIDEILASTLRKILLTIKTR